MWWFPQFFLSFSSFSLVAAFIPLSLSCISDQSFSCSSVFFFTFFWHSSLFLLFQPSFPRSLILLNLNISPHALLLPQFLPLFYFSFFHLFFLFFFSFLPLLFFLFISQLHQCDDFLNFTCNFVGALLPAPALYPCWIFSYIILVLLMIIF